ncbi:DUF1648 domain-containing protein [uncultured Weeksella sp.]|uniref:DUF1648 domain-containing protein n=1 Tax=uncultured Weeksella sp. TaxID=1161389 RepID=UPI00259B0D36|nr:DUF1648 domain-containing protein [uncultured Weeksella sp.]
MVLIITIYTNLPDTIPTHYNSAGQADGFGVWFLPMTLGLIFFPLIFFVVKSFKATK